MRFLPLSCLVAVSASLLTAAGPMAKPDRQRLLAHLEMTQTALAEELGRLSPAQLEFRASPDKWSVKDVVEHLAIAEPQYWQWLQESIKAAPAEFKREATDDAILWYGMDRTQRAKTAEARTPKENYKTATEAFEAWRKLRATMLDYAKSTEDDLRGRRFRDSSMDCWQWFLMISTHSQRHILQIQEIRRSPGFPKS